MMASIALLPATVKSCDCRLALLRLLPSLPHSRLPLPGQAVQPLPWLGTGVKWQLLTVCDCHSARACVAHPMCACTGRWCCSPGTHVLRALSAAELWGFFSCRTMTSASTATTLRAMTTRWLSGAWVWMMRATTKESSSPRARRSHGG